MFSKVLRLCVGDINNWQLSKTYLETIYRRNHVFEQTMHQAIYSNHVIYAKVISLKYNNDDFLIRKCILLLRKMHMNILDPTNIFTHSN